jgi:hypothetical protein
MPTYAVDIEIKETRSILVNAASLAAAVEQSVELEEKIRNQDDTPPALVTVTEVNVVSIEELQEQN